MEVAIRFEDLGKKFPGVVALDKVCFELRKGDVHGLVGENGAGKSTLGNILAGKYNEYDGKIYFYEQEVRITSPQVAKKRGICIVFQELNLIPALDVVQNIFLGQEIVLAGAKFVRDRKRMTLEANKILLEDLKVKIDVKKKVRDLSVSEQQVISIAKGLVSNADLFVFDEPTSCLTRSEIDNLFRIIKELKVNNKTLIFISHRLEEIFNITDRITILRDGKHIITKDTRSFTHDELINAMAGRKVDTRYLRSESYQDEVLLMVKNLSRRGEFEGIDFCLHKGEILGLAGVVGAGRTNVVKTIFGATKKTGGVVLVKGKEANIKSPMIAIRNGIGLLTEDRRNESLITKLNVLKNIILPNLNKVTKNGFINFRLAREYGNSYKKQFDIKTPSLLQKVELLSGGNQQKVVLSKWLFADVEILILDEPTKGIDISTKFEIYKIIKQLSDEGYGILVISSEIPELLGICHTVMIMREGKQIEILENKNLTQDKLLSLAIIKNE